MTGKRGRGRLVPRHTKAQRRKLLAREIVRHVVYTYGQEDGGPPWRTDYLRDYAQELRKLGPPEGGW